MLLTTITVAFVLALQATPQSLPSTEDLHTAYDNLKAAEEKKDVDLIKKWALETSNLAHTVIKAPTPTDAAEVEALKPRLEFAKEIDAYADYALYAAALRSSDRAKTIELYDALEAQSPKSEYIPKLNSLYLAALQQTGKTKQVFPFAEKAIARDPSNEELLAVLADGYMTRKQWEKAANAGSRLAQVLSNHPKPEGVSAGEWERHKDALLARGNWIAGISYANVNRYPQADKALRAALPLVQNEPALLPGALFYLGLANYNVARATHDKALMREALTFSEKAAAMNSPYQQSAGQNVWAIKGELQRWR